MGQLSNHNTMLRFAQLPGIPGDQPANQEREVAARRRLRRLNSDDSAKLVKAYLDGVTLRDLAVRYGINHHTAGAILKRSQVQRRQTRLSPTDVEEAIRLYLSGLSLSAVSREIGGCPNSIRNHLRKAGVKLRNTHGTA